mmetsp:Transcript_71468/g.155227  ORF Transcript_71468/g.155227 Transcript_71468/m.155227 type:complete len:899 (+) Transcript_71468:49-2745(+)
MKKPPSSTWPGCGEISTLGGGRENATLGDFGRVDDEPVFLRLRSARPPTGQDAVAGAEPIINLQVMPFNTWQIVKIQVKEKWPGLKGVPDTSIRLLYKGLELRSGTMVDEDLSTDGGTVDRPHELQYLLIDQRDAKGAFTANSSIGLYADAQVPCTNAMKKRVEAALAALLGGIQPRLTEDGTGATYMLRDLPNQRILAVFKPKDEEAFAPQNPRNYVGKENSTGFRYGVFSTQQAAREVAAHLLDHEKFAGVPETTLVHSKHPKFVKVKQKVVWKIGAFQAFVETKDTAGNFAPQVFSTTSVHRISILDIRIVNLDRNDGNLLVRHSRGTSRYELVPIDHGLSLPDRLEVYVDDIAWMSWPQAHEQYGEKELEYIRNLNGPKDARLLSTCLGIRRECLRLLEVTTLLLQLGAEHGLTPYEIGTLLYREDRAFDLPVQPSPLEKIIESCLDIAITIAGDGSMPRGVSTTLSGLDLQTSHTSATGTRSNAKYFTDSADSKAMLTPQLGPASPTPPSPRLCLSPLNIPRASTVPAEGPPDLLLDGCSGSDTPKVKVTFKADTAITDRGQSIRTQVPALRSSVSKRAHKAGSAKVWQRHREGQGRDAKGIFARRDLPASSWSAALEKAFTRHVTLAITDLIRKTFGKSRREGLSSVAAENGTTAGSPRGGDDSAEDAGAFAAAEGRKAEQKSAKAVQFSSALRDALPEIRPSEPAATGRARYVPPQRRAAEAAEAAADIRARAALSSPSGPTTGRRHDRPRASQSAGAPEEMPGDACASYRAASANPCGVRLEAVDNWALPSSLEGDAGNWSALRHRWLEPKWGCCDHGGAASTKPPPLETGALKAAAVAALALGFVPCVVQTVQPDPPYMPPSMFEGTETMRSGTRRTGGGTRGDTKPEL